ncbi:MAG TPA: SRPBCC family protein [Acidobacteriota bacterium]|nr:SRPBCC family protein [Acidobacteriota bacterium]
MIWRLKKHLFETEIELAEPREKVFEFFSKAENLDLLTPPWLNFRFITPLPIEMRAGAIIEYKLRLYGVPVRWKTEITKWQPPLQFEDTQARGPFKFWVHRHSFEEKDGGTLMRDRVEYAVPGWILEPLVHGLFVRRSVERIFEFRRRRLSEIFTVRGNGRGEPDHAAKN